MKPIQQTKFGADGNCLAASIASVLERQIDEVPDFVSIYENLSEAEQQFPIASQIASLENGFCLTTTFFDGTEHDARKIAYMAKDTNGYFVAVGTTRDLDGVIHANVWNQNGFVFDPSLSGENRIVNMEMAYIVLKVDKPKEQESYQQSLNLEQK